MRHETHQEIWGGSPQLPTPLTATGTGSIDARDRTGSVVFVMNAGNDPDLKKALGGSTLRLQELVDGTTVYVKLPPPIASKLPGGRPWMKVDLAKASGIAGFSSLATISLDRVPDTLPSASQKGAKQAVSSIEQLTGLKQLPVDAWIDANNLIRRMRLSFAESLAPSVKLNIGMTMDFVKYGPQPKPAFPSADQVSDASSLSSVGG